MLMTLQVCVCACGGRGGGGAVMLTLIKHTLVSTVDWTGKCILLLSLVLMCRPKGYVGSARDCVGIKYMVHGKLVSASHMLDQLEWR